MPAENDRRDDTARIDGDARAEGAGLRDLLRRSFEHSESVIALASPADMEHETPCPLFDVRTLVGHMLFAAQRMGAAGRREAVAEDGPAVTGLSDAAWVKTFSGAASQALDAWGATDAMTGDIVLPFGTFPAPFVCKMYIVEQTTHAWDLATALHSLEHLDGELAEVVLPVAREIIQPAFRGGEPMPFAAVVEVSADAPPYDRLAGFMGRHPGTA